MVVIPLATTKANDIARDDSAPPTEAEVALAAAVDSVIDDKGQVSFVQKVNEQEMWNWCRRQILADPVHAARMTGIAALAHLRHEIKPQADIKLDAIRDLYTAKAEANWRTKGQVRSAFQRLAKLTKAETLADLSTEVLKTFRDAVNADLAPSAAAQVFGKLKSSLSFAAKEGMDPEQITAVLGRMRVLTTPKSITKADPHPIAPEAFRKLLGAADAQWRAILLLSLNLALYLEDVAGLQWEDFDLKAGTFVGRRQKTQVIRCGCLWPETVTAIKALPRKANSPYLFTSATGTRYKGESLYNAYLEFRTDAGVNVVFSSMRDGAYTHAAQACEERFVRVLVGHRMAGLTDNYVMRNPAWVKPATDAIYTVYAPFPSPTA